MSYLRKPNSSQYSGWEEYKEEASQAAQTAENKEIDKGPNPNDLSDLAITVASMCRDSSLKNYKPSRLNLSGRKQNVGMNSQAKESKQQSIRELYIRDKLAYPNGVNLELTLKAAVVMYSEPSENALDKNKLCQIRDELRGLTLSYNKLSKSENDNKELPIMKQRIDVLTRKLTDLQKSTEKRQAESKASHARRALKIMSVGNKAAEILYDKIVKSLTGLSLDENDLPKKFTDGRNDRRNSLPDIGDRYRSNYSSYERADDTGRPDGTQRYERRRMQHSQHYENVAKDLTNVEDGTSKGSYVPPHLRKSSAYSRSVNSSPLPSSSSSLDRSLPQNMFCPLSGDSQVNETVAPKVSGAWASFNKSILTQPAPLPDSKPNSLPCSRPSSRPSSTLPTLPAKLPTPVPSRATTPVKDANDYDTDFAIDLEETGEVDDTNIEDEYDAMLQDENYDYDQADAENDDDIY